MEKEFSLFKNIIDTISKDESVRLYIVDDMSYSEQEDPSNYIVTADIEMYIRYDPAYLIKTHLPNLLEYRVLYIGADNDSNLAIALMGK